MHPRALLLVLPLFACGGDDNDISPRTGPWKFLVADLTTNSCGTYPDLMELGSFEITDAGGGEFTFQNDQGGTGDHAFTCDIDGASFDCPAWVEPITEPMLGTLTFTFSYSGDLSENSMAGTARVIMDCSGSVCPTFMKDHGIAGYPCAYERSFVAQPQ